LPGGKNGDKLGVGREGNRVDCPKCEGVLQPNQIKQQLVYICPECAGLWLRYGQLKPLLAAWAEGIDFVRPKHQQLAGVGKPYSLNFDQLMGPCPACPTRTLMIPEARDIGGVLRIDYCPRGHGFWLDAIEIRQIQSRILNKSQEVYEALGQSLLPGQEAA
jgi:Zn-finger nucleic acid-binding protein